MDLNAFLAQDRFAREIGIETLHAEPGLARARLNTTDAHRNSVGLVHGGAIFSLAATAFFAAANAEGTTALGINLGINYLNPVESGTLLAEAVEISRSRKISTCDVRVTNEEEKLIAVFRGTAFLKGRWSE